MPVFGENALGQKFMQVIRRFTPCCRYLQGFVVY
jgi:hypothetical protein